jgi:hypothetical protein
LLDTVINITEVRAICTTSIDAISWKAYRCVVFKKAENVLTLPLTTTLTIEGPAAIEEWPHAV